jgi:hypothetical protein
MARRKNKRIAYFHEDDHCQIQVLPAENWQHCASQLGQIAEFSEKTPDAGWHWLDRHPRPSGCADYTVRACNQ